MFDFFSWMKTTIHQSTKRANNAVFFFFFLFTGFFRIDQKCFALVITFISLDVAVGISVICINLIATKLRDHTTAEYHDLI